MSEAEQLKLFTIEELLGYPVPKASIDASFGETPAYYPQPKRNSILTKTKTI